MNLKPKFNLGNSSIIKYGFNFTSHSIWIGFMFQFCKSNKKFCPLYTVLNKLMPETDPL